MSKLDLDAEKARAFLKSRFRGVGDLIAVESGQWSAAYFFDAGSRRLVARFGRYGEDYEKDRYAYRWTSPELPVVRTLEVGEAFGGFYAISERADGEPLDDLPAERLRACFPSALRVLQALSRIELPGDGYGIWTTPDVKAPHGTWLDYLRAARHAENRFGPWEEGLSKLPAAVAVRERALTTLEQLAPSCGERRGLVHGDLLAGNTLVQGDQISAVLDWGNAVAGDPLYDLAWLELCSIWHPGFAGISKLGRALYDSDHFDERLRCYQLHIGIGSIHYNAARDRLEEVGRVASYLAPLAA